MSNAKIKLKGIVQEKEVSISLKENTVELNGKKYSLDQLTLDAPVNGTIYGALLNYKGALADLGDAVNEAPYKEAPKAPILYIKPENTIIGQQTAIPLPEGMNELQIGATLGLVIGKSATKVSTDEALDYIAGYTIVNDVSVPHDSVYRPAIKQKCRDGFCPVGPWVINRDAVKNPDSLDIRVFINGELRQENTTKNLIRSVSQLVADITDFMTLHEGDVLLVGVPEKAPLAKAGDKVRIEIDQVGYLENTIVPENEIVKGGTNE